ncbi:unnamed protein product, partial [Cyprideis torosa]
CELPCPEGTHGEACAQTCRCQNGGTCDHVTGACLCGPGWRGDVCANTCPEDTWGEDCKNSCECYNGGLCHHVTGVCKCLPGFEGERCQSMCPTGTYGKHCDRKCLCVNGGRCSPIDGSCTCVEGWEGPDCSKRACPNNFFGKGCANICNCDDDKTELCDPATGQCVCKPGWDGASCNRPCLEYTFGKGCKQYCNCTNDAYCNPVDGSCVCAAGFIGETCDTPCPRGKYGDHCSSYCKCKNGATCNHKNGHCECPPGEFPLSESAPPGEFPLSESAPPGEFPLSESAPPGEFPLSESAPPGEFPLSESAPPGEFPLSESAPPGWSGLSCDTPCPAGTYGEDCERICSCKNGASCHPVTGECTCSAGYQVGWAGYQVGWAGYQVGWAGYQGKHCESRCDSWTYGLRCSQPCDCDADGAEGCDPATGTCICKPGFRDNHQLDLTTYFERCVVPEVSAVTLTARLGFGALTAPCPVPGACTGAAILRRASASASEGGTERSATNPAGGEPTERGAPKSALPVKTSAPQKLPLPHPRRECHTNFRCFQGNIFLSAANGPCNHITGQCNCAPGYTGISCDEPCPRGHYGADCLGYCDCKNKGECNHVTGECSCLPGWRGFDCSQPCPEDRYGYQCSLKCTCLNGGKCRKNDGFCKCEPGYTGPRCQESKWTSKHHIYWFNDLNIGFKLRECTGRSLWKIIVEGKLKCSFFKDVGHAFVSFCPENQFGDQCIEQCLCPTNGHFVCDPVVGCKCHPGYDGPNCSVSSNSIFTTYTTLQGERPEVETAGPNAGLIAGIVLTIFLVVIIGSVMFYYRRRLSKLKGELHRVYYQHATDGAPGVMGDADKRHFDNPVYEFRNRTKDNQTGLPRNIVHSESEEKNSLMEDFENLAVVVCIHFTAFLHVTRDTTLLHHPYSPGQREENSANHGQFGPAVLAPGHCGPVRFGPRRFRPRTFRPWHISAPYVLAPGDFRPMRFSPGTIRP